MSGTLKFSPSAAALPTEIPAPPDLSKLPIQVLHSGTVESLIGLNDDLTARLKVNLRRNSALEQKIMEQERQVKELNRANESLDAQVDVLKEKEITWNEKASQAEALKSRLATVEERNRQLRLAAAYVRRIRAWVEPGLARLKRDYREEKKMRMTREAQVSDLKARLNETVSDLQGLEKKFAKDQARLVEQYEARQKMLSAEIEKLRTEGKLAREKAQRLDEITAKRAELENRLVFVDRRNEELEAQVVQLQADAGTLQEAKDEARFAREESARLQEQLDSLQAVWSDSKRRLESLSLQHERLNDLNVELSRKLKDQKTPSARQPEANI